MRAAKVDANQSLIVGALRDMGCSVEPLHRVGQGCPDLLVGFMGRNVLIEVKDGSKPPSARQLNDVQKEWHLTWNGQVGVANNIDEAVEIVRGALS